MRKTFLKILVVAMFVALLPSFAGAQTNVLIKLSDGTQQSMTIATTGGITFSYDSVVNINSGSNVVSYNFSRINKIVFDHTNAINEATLATQSFRFYPNPSKDYITIETSDETSQNVTIYSSTGVVVHQGMYQSGEKIDVSNLARGFYIIKINTNALKMYKL